MNSSKENPPDIDDLEKYEALRGIEFRANLERIINAHSQENGSDTPDFILAEYMTDCLAAFDKAVTRRAHLRGETTTVSRETLPPIRHVAGPYKDGLQKCVNCGRIITDYRGDVAVPESDIPPGKTVEDILLGFPEGIVTEFGVNPVCWGMGDLPHAEDCTTLPVRHVVGPYNQDASQNCIHCGIEIKNPKVFPIEGASVIQTTINPVVWVLERNDDDSYADVKNCTVSEPESS